MGENPAFWTIFNNGSHTCSCRETKFKSKRFGEVYQKKVDEVIDPYAGLYDEVPVDIWREQAGVEHDDDEPLF